MTLRVGLIGCGMIGAGCDAERRPDNAKSHAGAVSAVDGLELTAVCDVDTQRAKQAANRFGATKRFISAAEMLSTERFDIIAVTVGPMLQPALAEQIATCSAKVALLEKPVAASAMAARQMRQRLNENSRTQFAVNYWRNWHPRWRQVAQAANDLHWGPLRVVNARFTGGLANNGGHLICWLNTLGITFDVERLATHFVGEVNADRSFAFRGEQSGKSLLVQFTDIGPIGHALIELELLFERGNVRITDASRRVEVSLVGDDPDFAGYSTLRPPLAHEALTSPDLSQVYRQLRDVALGVEKAPLVTLNDACAVLELVERMEAKALDANS